MAVYGCGFNRWRQQIDEIVRLSNYPYAAAFEETIDTLHGTRLATDNSGYIIFRIPPWKSRSTFSISYVLKPNSMTSR
jgi:hypothetical protein